MEQSIDTGDGAPAPSKAPVTPFTKVEAPPKRNTTEALIDSAMEFLSEEKPSNDNAKEAPLPPKRQRREEPEPEEGEEPEEAPEGEEPEEELPETDEEPEGDEPEEDDGAGSKEQPFRVQDLPEDKFIEIKVDGQKQVISLKELGAGYIREQTFNSRINQTQRLTQEATQAVQQAQQIRERTREEFRDFVTDPEQIFSFFMGTDEREKVFKQAAAKYAELLNRWAARPQEQLAWQRKRDQERLAMEREAFESQKRAAEDARRKQEADAQARAIFEPGWQAGLRKAGFPTPTKELFEEVMVRVHQKAKTGQMITSDDIAEYTYRASKLLELQPANAKPKPKAPASTRRPAERSTSASKRRDPWANMTPQQRKKDPDYWLRGLRDRDFR